MSKALREARAKAHSEALGFLSINNKQGFDRAMTEVDRLGLEIRKSESKTGFVEQRFEIPFKSPDRAFAFDKWIRRGKGGITDAEMRSIEYRDVSEGSQVAHIGTYTGLGYLIPTGFVNAIEQATKWFAPLTDGSVFTAMPTATGNALPFPISNDTNQSAVIVGEASPTS